MSNGTATRQQLPPEQSEAIQQARARAQRLALAFQSVFGKAKGRTADQTLVLEHLAICAGDNANSYRFDQASDGIALIAAGLHRDGARPLLRVIERQISIAPTAKLEKPATPKTVR